VFEMSQAIGLDGLRPGEECEVEAVLAEAAFATRLADLGFCPGTAVRVVRRAPLGDPVLYELRGYQIALRSREASLIRVRPKNAAPETRPRAPEERP
jgi:ferrous iron transport protein A